MIICIVNNSVLLVQILLCHLNLCLKATSSESSHLFPSIILNYIFFKGVSIMTQMMKML